MCAARKSKQKIQDWFAKTAEQKDLYQNRAEQKHKLYRKFKKSWENVRAGWIKVISRSTLIIQQDYFEMNWYLPDFGPKLY